MATEFPAQTRIAHLAAALYGVQLGRAGMVNAVASAAALPGGVDELADRVLATEFPGLSTVALARRVAALVGIRPDLQDEAARAVAQALEQAGSARGQMLGSLLDRFAAIDPAEPVWGEQAARFRGQVSAALDWAGTERTAAKPFITVLRVELEPGIDSIYNGASGTWLDVHALRVGGHQTLQPEDAYNAGSGWGRLNLVADGAGPVLQVPRALSTAELVVEPRADGGRPLLLDAGAHPRTTVHGGAADVTFERLSLGELKTTADAELAFIDTAATTQRVQFSGAGLGLPHEPTALVIELMDTRAATDPDPLVRAAPLRASPYNGIAFQLAGQTVLLKDEVPDAVERASFNGAQTYDELLQALRTLLARPANLERWPALAQVSAELGVAFESRSVHGGEPALGTSIVLRVPADSALVLASGHFIADDGVPAAADLHTVMREEAHRRHDAPVARVVLDRVGPGGAIVVGMAPGEDLPGIERFEVTVERDSSLGRLESTGSALKELVAASGLDRGTLTLEQPGLVDVRLVDLTGMQAATRVEAALTPAALAKYGHDPRLDEGVRWIGGVADDTLVLSIAPEVALQPALRLVLQGGDGNDRVQLQVTGRSAAPAQGEWRIEPGPGNDRLELVVPDQSVTLVFAPGFGHDRIVGLDHGDRLDLSALGGLRHAATLPAEPAAGALAVQAGAIFIAPLGAAGGSAAAVAARFADSGDAGLRQLLYVAYDASGRGEVWRIDDPAGMGNLSASSMGSITLDGPTWAGLGADSFG